MSVSLNEKATGTQSPVSGAGNSGLNIDASSVLTLRPGGLLIAGAGAPNATRLVAIRSPSPFQAIQIAYQHIGGIGDCTGIKAVVASTDDPGPMDYSLGGASATLKKIVTPKKAGVEYNALSANGWRAVTWGGAASASITDPGAGLIGLATSDIIPCESVQAADGLYYALVRVYDGAGVYTRTGYAGMTTGTQYGDDSYPWHAVQMYRGGDHCTDPSTWTTAITPSWADPGLCPIVVRLYGPTTIPTLMVVGDSRLDAVSEAGPSYRGSDYLLQQSLKGRGKTVALVRSAFGGATSAQYLHHASQVLSVSAPDVSIRLVYTVNDGAPTQSAIAVAKARARSGVQADLAAGVRPVLVTAWPRDGMSATELALLRGLDTWAAATGLRWSSPLALLGTEAGGWATGMGYNTDHGRQVAYQVWADNMSEKLISWGYV